MFAKEITRENLLETIRRPGIVLLDWWAEWCGPCRSFAPVFEASAAKHADVLFGKIDTEAQPELAATFKITSIPTLMAFRDGLPLFQHAGALPANDLEELIHKVRNLNMDEVKREIKENAGEVPPA